MTTNSRKLGGNFNARGDQTVTWLCVTQDGTNVPNKLIQAASLATVKTAVRFAGGCSGWDAESKAKLQPYMLTALANFKGVAMSGGTNSGIAQIPGWLANAYEVIGLGTFPRTHDWGIQDSDGQLSLTEYGDQVGRGQQAVGVIQKDGNTVLDWDGDLEMYFNFLLNLRQEAGWNIGVTVLNGGGITKKEIAGAIERKIPLIVVGGTGRAADEFITQYNSGTGSFDGALIETAKNSGLVSFADYSDPATLTAALMQHNLLSVPVVA